MMASVVKNVELWKDNFSTNALFVYGARLVARTTHVAQPAGASVGIQLVPQEEFNDQRRDYGWLYVTSLKLPNGENVVCDQFMPCDAGGWRWAIEVIRQGSHAADLFADGDYIPFRITCMVVNVDANNAAAARPFTLARHSDITQIATIWRNLLTVLENLSLLHVSCDMAQLIRVKDALAPPPPTAVSARAASSSSSSEQSDADAELKQLKDTIDKLQRDYDRVVALDNEKRQSQSEPEVLRQVVVSIPSDRLEAVLDATNELENNSDVVKLRELRDQLLGNKAVQVSAKLVLAKDQDASLRTLLAAAVGQRLAVLIEKRVQEQKTLNGVWEAMRDLNRASRAGIEIDATRHFLLRGVLERQAYECAQRELLGVNKDADTLWGIRIAWFAEAQSDSVMQWRLDHLLPFLDKALFRAFISFTGSCVDLEKLRMWRAVVAQHKYKSPIEAFELVEPHALVLIDAAIARLQTANPVEPNQPEPDQPAPDKHGLKSPLQKALEERRRAFEAPNPYADIALVPPSKLKSKQVDMITIRALLEGRAASLSDAPDDNDAVEWEDQNVRAKFPQRAWCALLTDDSLCAEEWRACRAPLQQAVASGEYVEWFGLAMFRPDHAASAESLVGGALVGMRKSGDMDIVAMGAIERLAGVSVLLAAIEGAPSLRESRSKEIVNAFRSKSIAAFNLRLYVDNRGDAGAAATYAATKRALMTEMDGDDATWMFIHVQAQETPRFILQNEILRRRAGMSLEDKDDNEE